jgi:hypothetical protein
LPIAELNVVSWPPLWVAVLVNMLKNLPCRAPLDHREPVASQNLQVMAT